MRRLIGAIALAIGAAPALSGPDWMEGSAMTGDAPSFPDDAAQPIGAGPLNTISGELEGLPGPIGVRGVADFEDVYRIFIFDPQIFQARTDGGDPDSLSFADFDSALYLFDSQGFGVLANRNTNDSTAVDPNGAFLLPLANDGSGAVIPAPGVYFLAITGEGAEALSSGGTQPIFDFFSSTETSGPDGLGNMAPLDQWQTGFEEGLYLIHLQGAHFFECIADLNYDGVVDSNDLSLLLGAWGANKPPFDFDWNGVIDANDLAVLLGAWGPCPF